MTADVDRLVEFLGDMRERYGYPREGPPLTMQQQKDGETRNCERLVTETILAHGGKKDLAKWSPVWHGAAVHDRDLPNFAYLTTVIGECWTEEAAKDLVASAWNGPEWPEGNYGARIWREMFARVGFVEDFEDVDSVAPTEVPDLWRGAIHSRRKGMAWTSDRERASWFARRFGAGGPFKQGHLWHLPAGTVPAKKVLARFESRGESEWVIDTRGLTPTKVEEGK